jgi:ankyrin repeat protein
MIEAKASVDQQTNEGSTGIHLACLDGHAECVRQLIDSNADVQVQDKYGQTGLTLAAWQGQPKCLQLMIEGKADINHQPHEDGVFDALSAAVRQRHMDCVCVLIDHPSDAPASDYV